jgi:hypothetical protein
VCGLASRETANMGGFLKEINRIEIKKVLFFISQEANEIM